MAGVTAAPPRELTTREAATYCQVSTTAIKQWAREGLPRRKTCRSYMIAVDDLDAFVAARKAAREQRAADRIPDVEATLPTEPLIPLLHRHAELEPEWKGRLSPGIRDAIARPRISIYLADQLACLVGVHPCRIWGSDWWSA